MATPILTTGLSVLSTADTTTNWTLLTTLDPDVKKQGTNSVSGAVRTSNIGYYTTTSLNLTNTHIRIWFNYAAVGYLNTKANGGIAIYVLGGTAGYWYIDGIDTYEGGWVLLTVDTSRAFDSGSATLSSVTRVGVSINLTSSPRNVVNTWVDYVVYGNGLTTSGGTTEDRIDLLGTSQLDLTNGYGILKRTSGVYFLSSNFTIGNSARATYMDINNQVVIFENLLVNSNLYNITLDATGPATVVNIQNSVIKSESKKNRLDFFANTANMTDLTINATTVANGDVFEFNATNQTITGTTFQNCNSITTNGATFEGNIISGGVSTTGVLKISSSMSGISNCQFINNNTAIEISAAGTYTFDNLYFEGNTYDFKVSATTGAVVINVINGGNVATYTTAGATVEINNQVSITLTGIKDGTEVRVYETSTGNELGTGVENLTGGTFVYTYNNESKNIYFVLVNLNYQVVRLDLVQSGTPLIIPIQQIVDRVYSNPPS